MAKKCFVTGKSGMVVNSVIRRGKAKAQGGVGRKVTGVTKHRQKANLQKKTVIVDGEVKRVWLSTKALRRLPENIQVI
ncbi:50S ribosomal protein L28 [Deinococcus peraridilitoris]|uniref:Large ribosomal subunit protein bL28 n=1 Tax=Deinococcus peraridilitoris (strain DSM 19664 / LMG 22246 / CIP 109416 / KR-200) TaxID=937777 RepID=L0A289_DEIPD|nr:50S ribosomal protein L28 [Deinococcus peraridilitoris]AFZ67966.1 ribosomal protein L28 [Deinococcus peraridilitoris DSM 19664]